MDLKGKHIAVFGGTSGIGLAAVSQLVQAGAKVVAASHTEQRVKEAQAKFSTVEFVQADVLDRDALDSFFSARDTFDAVVSCATGGARVRGPFMDMDLAAFKGCFDKLWGYVNIVQAAVPHLAENGCIVIVSGSPARKCRPGMSAISTVGNAVEGFCRAVALEIAPKRLNVLAPGIIDTPMFAAQGEERESFFRELTKDFAIPRAGTADEAADGILFLLRNDYVAGSVLDVDGGALLP